MIPTQIGYAEKENPSIDYTGPEFIGHNLGNNTLPSLKGLYTGTLVVNGDATNLVKVSFPEIDTTGMYKITLSLLGSKGDLVKREVSLLVKRKQPFIKANIPFVFKGETGLISVIATDADGNDISNKVVGNLQMDGKGSMFVTTLSVTDSFGVTSSISLKTPYEVKPIITYGKSSKTRVSRLSKYTEENIRVTALDGSNLEHTVDYSDFDTDTLGKKLIRTTAQYLGATVTYDKEITVYEPEIRALLIIDDEPTNIKLKIGSVFNLDFKVLDYLDQEVALNCLYERKQGLFLYYHDTLVLYRLMKDFHVTNNARTLIKKGNEARIYDMETFEIYEDLVNPLEVEYLRYVPDALGDTVEVKVKKVTELTETVIAKLVPEHLGRTIVNEIDMSRPGVYKLVIQAEDSFGNSIKPIRKTIYVGR